MSSRVRNFGIDRYLIDVPNTGGRRCGDAMHDSLLAMVALMA